MNKINLFLILFINLQFLIILYILG